MTNIAALLESQEDRNHFFFNAIRNLRTENNRKKKLEHSWESRDYKFYPSAIKSLRMCPYNHVHQEVHKAPDFPIQSVYSMDMGNAVHRLLQTQALQTPEILWPAPSFDHMPVEHAITLREKLKAEWPEVPVFDPWSWTSGRADLVLNVYGEPVVVDIKTKNLLDIDYEKDRKTGEKVLKHGRWEDLKASLPSEEHKMQVAIYATLMNEFKYYEKPITRAGVIYLNLSVKPGEVAAEAEYYFDVTLEFQQSVKDLLYTLGQERMNFLNGVESKCTYPLCRIHGEKASAKSKSNANTES